MGGGTYAGGKKAERTNKARYGEDFYTTIGALGGRKSRGGGFARNPELAREAGRRGGMASRRGKKKVVEPKPADPLTEAVFDEFGVEGFPSEYEKID